MKNDKFLLGILVFIGVLVAAALILYATDRSAQEYLPDGTPEAAVHNYTLAVTRGDYERAYTYLASGDQKPTEIAFRTFFTQYNQLQNYGLRVGDAEILDDEAVVDVTVLYGSTGPFDRGFDSPGSATLVLEEGEWRINAMPYPYWDFSWYMDPVP